MVTDKERREVARRLRERAGKRILNLGELLWCIGCDDGDDAAAWNRLADLIEPGDMSQACRDTVAYDRDALLALADDMEGFGGENDRTLRKMGILVDSWASCARRIRKALGVES